VVEASVRPATRNNGLIQFPDRSYVTVQNLHVTQSASVGICPASSGRYVRILGMQWATPFRYSLYQFEIYR
jgi:hypothetical protein